MKNEELVFFDDIYAKYLTLIEGINFTPREIDVIACLVNARGTSKISSFLEIAPSTVVTHIHNIMKKLNRNSREDIIDFVETSQKGGLIKTHYTQLVIHAAFEKSLKEVAKAKAYPPLPLVLFKNSQKESHEQGAKNLKTHLKLASVDIDVRHEDAYKEKDFELSAYLCVVFVEREEKNEKFQRVFNITFIDLTDSIRYYYSVFTLLKKALPDLDLSRSITPFENKSQGMKESIFVYPQSSLQKAQKEKKGIFYDKIRQILQKKNLIFLSLLLCLLALAGGFLILRNIPDKSSLFLIRSELAIPTESLFLDRPSLITLFNAAFKKKEGIQTLALIGGGGIGKTILARHYARQQEANVIWEINAETPENIRNSFESLASKLANEEIKKKALGKILEIQHSAEREEKILHFVKEQLKSSSSWFLIYDNVRSFSDLKNYFPNDMNTWGKGNIILTTRNNALQKNQHISSTLHIGPLTQAEKYSLFQKIMGHEVTSVSSQSKDIGVFLEEIPPFPLDISLAAYYLKITHTSYPQYVENLRQGKEKFLALQESLLKESGEYTKTRYGLIAVSAEHIIATNKDFCGLLLLVSLLDSQGIHRELLDDYKDKLVVDSFLYHLTKHSLIADKPLKASSSKLTFSIHRSTQAMLLSYFLNALNVKKEDSLLTSLIDAVEIHAHKAMAKENFSKIKNLIPNLCMLLSHKNFLNDTNAGAIESILGCLYYYTHYHEKGIKALESGMIKLKNHPNKKNYVRIAQALAYLGNSNKELGKFEQGKTYLKESISLYKKYDTANPIGLMRSLTSLGDIYKNLGDYTKARECLEESLFISKKYPGEDPIGEARTMGYLGILYRDLGNYDKSILLLKESLHLLQTHSPENYVGIARALKYLGNAYRNLGRYEEAKDFLTQSLVMCETYLDENQISLGRTLVHLATIYKGLGKYQKAEDLLDKSLKIHCQVFGKENVRTAWVVTQLGTLYRETGNYEKAKVLIEKSLTTYEHSYGDKNLKTSWVSMQLAYVYEDLQKHSEARKLLEKALHFHKKHFPDHKSNPHRKVAMILSHLGNVYGELKDLDKAKDCLTKSLQTHEKIYGKNHSETAKVLCNLGKVYRIENNLTLAEDVLNRALIIFSRSHHPDIFWVYEECAALYDKKARVEQEKGRVVQAKTFKAQATYNLNKALKVVTTHFSRDSMHIKRIRDTLQKNKAILEGS